MPTSRPAGLTPLLVLNVFMADMQAGIGPFLGVYLLAHHWQSGPIGTVMTLGGIAGLVMTIPAGALIDHTTHKRSCIAVSGVCTVLASALLLSSSAFAVVAVAQMATAIAGAAIGPGVAGITLGLVRQAGFARQNGRNQVANHAGNVAGAGLSGLLGWLFGFPAIIALAALFGMLSIAAVYAIPRGAIDDKAARGLPESGAHPGQASGLSVLLRCPPLLVLAACLAAFHLGNGAMLPLFGVALAAEHQGDPASLVATTIVVAQAVMVVAALAAMRLAAARGYWLVMLLSFLALPLRGLLAAHLVVAWGVFPVQMLDGIGAGLQSVAVPGLVARILNNTGRINSGQGAVAAAQGIGAALSPALGGWIAQALGYPTMFTCLGSLALVSIALWLGFGKTVKPACA